MDCRGSLSSAPSSFGASIMPARRSAIAVMMGGESPCSYASLRHQSERRTGQGFDELDVSESTSCRHNHHVEVGTRQSRLRTWSRFPHSAFRQHREVYELSQHRHLRSRHHPRVIEEFTAYHSASCNQHSQNVLLSSFGGYESEFGMVSAG
ncbi:hypothetical protein K469DRAFT_346311 [Zopfia rhizophila CBS 207.26]|uniref:Uncharacterized protein n=1 Tax=Zopfia rhizophila CBS 207.26 TaxID=1314779 RepID=A0A6A6ELH9_9PEZI|nr:hypothetical protein K469DRAFT_346311 [Zopfia rhizophila CBS 207.26]